MPLLMFLHTRLVPFFLGSLLGSGGQWILTTLIASAASPCLLRAGPVGGTIRIFLSERRLFTMTFLTPAWLRVD